MHFNLDEYAVPVTGVPEHAQHFSKTLPVTGSVEYRAYSGPTTASSLATYLFLAAQLRSAGFTPDFECAKEGCGGFDFATLLSKPVIDATPGDYGFKLIAALMPTGGDMRYGAFHRAGEYVCIMSALGPGKPSGALVIRVGPPLPTSAPPTTSASAPMPNAQTSTSTPAASPSKVRAAARSLWNRIPQ